MNRLLSKNKLWKIISSCIAVLLLVFINTEEIRASGSNEYSEEFDLTSPDYELFRKKELENNTVLQSMAFDNNKNEIFTVQLMAGGQQLPGEDEPVSGPKRDLHGDLALTQLDMNGNQLGHMYLKGFGHGVSIGTESVDGKTYIWMESDATADDGEHGWGKSLVRFPFENGAVLDSDSEDLEKFNPIENADRTTVDLDNDNNILTMRYRKDGDFHYAIFPLDELKNHHYEPISDVKQPEIGTFQGFVSRGDYLYLLEGNSYENEGSDYGNTFITTVDIENKNVKNKQLITSALDLPFREPEGITTFTPNPDNPEKAMLFYGFASLASPPETPKEANIYGFMLNSEAGMETMSLSITDYDTSNDLKSSLAKHLDGILKQSLNVLKDGNDNEAAEYMKVFKDHLNDSSVKGEVSMEAKEKLNQNADAVIENLQN